MKPDENVIFPPGATLETHRAIMVSGTYLLISRDFPMEKLKADHPDVEEVTDEAKLAQIANHLSADKGRSAIAGAIAAGRPTQIIIDDPLPPMPDLTRFMPKQGSQNRAQRRAAKKGKR